MPAFCSVAGRAAFDFRMDALPVQAFFLQCLMWLSQASSSFDIHQFLPPPSSRYSRMAAANWFLLVSMSWMFTLSAF